MADQRQPESPENPGNGEGGRPENPGNGERPDYLKDGAHALEAVRSYFGTHSEHMVATLANQVQLARIADVLEVTAEHASTNAEVLESMQAREDNVIGKFPSDMSHTVPADTQTVAPVETVRTPDEENYTRITAVSMGWPDGANNVVGIQLRTGNGLKLLPRNPEDDFLAFNDFTETFDMQFVLLPGEDLVAETVNLDTTNDHFVNIVPHIEEMEDYDGSERDSGEADEGGEN